MWMERAGDNEPRDEKRVRDAEVRDEKREWEQEKMGPRRIASPNAGARARVRLKNGFENEGETSTSRIISVRVRDY